jgi:hypothetical protein
LSFSQIWITATVQIQKPNQMTSTQEIPVGLVGRVEEERKVDVICLQLASDNITISQNASKEQKALIKRVVEDQGFEVSRTWFVMESGVRITVTETANFSAQVTLMAELVKGFIIENPHYNLKTSHAFTDKNGSVVSTLIFMCK